MIVFGQLIDAFFQVLRLDKCISHIEVRNNGILNCVWTQWHVKHVFKADDSLFGDDGVSYNVGGASNYNWNHISKLNVKDVLCLHKVIQKTTSLHLL